MGRHAGWIVAAGGRAQDADNNIPLVILFPEIEFKREAFIDKVKEAVQKYECCIVVSEGARRTDGGFLAEQGSRRAFGHAQLGGVAAVVADLTGPYRNLSATGRQPRSPARSVRLTR